MKTETIHCDICKRHVDLEKDQFLAMYESIRVELTPTLQKMPIKTCYDICRKCAEEIENVINEQVKRSIKKIID